MANSKKISSLGGSIGRINWLSIFPDGSGLITANEEGLARIYRFDKSYYRDEMWSKLD